MNCLACTKVLREGARFCDNCGAPVATSDALLRSDGAETLRDPDPLVGHTLDGKYELLWRLGEGGMGVVYRVRRIHIGDEVAVKVLPQKFVANTASVERFRREARAAAMLRHPNVVAIYDYGEAKGDAAPAYIVMELLDGVSLRRLLQCEQRLAPARAVSLMRDVCAGVGAAHRRGVFHRDLKPDNVIVLPPNEDREGEVVKVVDFGIAKLRDASGVTSLTETGAVVGTPFYMSPEQCRGEPLDARSDVYSLGAMLYEMLAGTPPFTAETVTGVIAKHLFEAPPPLAPALGVAAALEEVIMRALAKDPAARQPEAATLMRELQEAEQRRRAEDGETPFDAAAAAARISAEQRREDSQRVEREAASSSTPSSSSLSSTPPSSSSSASLSSNVVEEQERPTEKVRLEETIESARARHTSEGPEPETEESARPKREDVRDGSRRKRAALVAAALVLVVAVAVSAALLFGGRGEPPANENASLVKNLTNENNVKVSPPGGGNANVSGERPAPEGMAYVPGGGFAMGRDDSADEAERPSHNTTVAPFFIDKYEVTREEYAKFLSAAPGRAAPRGTARINYPGTERQPVTGVTWDEARVFCESAGKRLPTEEEWEFAARGADGRRYPWGNDWTNGMANANGERRGPSVVGSYNGESPYGARDMVGNVWEWTASAMRAYPGGRLPPNLPKGDLKVIRGGSYESDKNYATVTYRSGWPARGASTYDQTGFRCVKDAAK